MTQPNLNSERLAFPGSYFTISEYEDVWGDEWSTLFPPALMGNSSEVLASTTDLVE